MFNTLKAFLTDAPSVEDHLKATIQHNRNTPDRLLLDQQDAVLVFEYGELQHGMPRHQILNNSELLSAGFTDERFFMWTYRDGDDSFPIATKFTTPNAPKTRLAGELYKVKSWHVSNLDNYRRNGVHFKRKLSRILLPCVDKIGRPEHVIAWVYVGTDVWNKKIEWDTSFYRGRDGAVFFPPQRIMDDPRGTITRQIASFGKVDMIPSRAPDLRYMYTTQDMVARKIKNNADEETIQAAVDFKVAMNEYKKAVDRLRTEEY